MNPSKLVLVLCIINITNLHACWTALHYAVLTQDKQKVEAIFTRPGITKDERDALINQKDVTEGQTPLHAAVCYSTYEIMEILLKCDPRQDIHDKHGFLPIHYAASAGNIMGASMLFEKGATPNDLTLEHETPLLVATYNRHFPTANFFLDKGSNPNIQNNKGMTPLHWSILYDCSPDLADNDYYQNRLLLINLLQHHARLALKNSEGLTPEDFEDKSLTPYIETSRLAHMSAHNHMFAFAACLHMRLGHDSPANGLPVELMKYIYWLLLQDAYKPIELRERVLCK